MVYKYGEPDQYGDFPYIYGQRFSEAEFNELLLERLPESYDMQIVDPVELEILKFVTNQGIDSHLEACTMTKDPKVEDRKVGDAVIARHCALGYDPQGMICLIRRLSDNEFSPNDALIEAVQEYITEDDLSESYGETRKEKIQDKLFETALQLRSSILETLRIESI
jgi:hypothetical protein